jgi:SanA protein
MRFLKLFKALFFLAAIASLTFLLGISIWVYNEGNRDVVEEMPTTPMEYVIVLGASVKGDSLSGVLQSRMTKAIELFEGGLVRKILVSGDGTDAYYNETYAMAKFLVRKNIPLSAIEADTKGFSTFDSLKRAFEVFHIKSAYVVSQPFHISRAVWLANKVGIKAVGIPAAPSDEEWFYMAREIPARTKDFFMFYLDISPSDDREDGLFAK